MSYQSDIFDAIAADAPLGVLIGDRFSWDIADGSTPTPYLVAQTISTDGETDHDGDRSISFPLIQFTCWSPSKAETIAVMSALKTAIEGQDLPGSSNTSLGFAGEQSTYDSQTKYFGEIRDYRASAFIN